MTKTRIAVVGCGNAGTTLHLPALAGISSADVVGAADVDAARRAAAAEQFRVPVSPSAQAMLLETRPDVVIIGTLPHTHAELCPQAIEAGCDLICEKPFVSTLEEADRVIAAAHAVAAQQPGGVVFAQAWQNMDLPPWAEPGCCAAPHPMSVWSMASPGLPGGKRATPVPSLGRTRRIRQ